MCVCVCVVEKIKMNRKGLRGEAVRVLGVLKQQRSWLAWARG